VGGSALHSPSRPQARRWGSNRCDAGRLLSNELLGGLLPERLQETLHDRVLPHPELVGVISRSGGDDGERGQLWLCGKPGFDRGKRAGRAWMAYEPLSIGRLVRRCVARGSPAFTIMPASLQKRLRPGLMIVPAGRGALAARCCARISGTTIDAIAEFLLDRADLANSATGSSVRYCSRSRLFTAVAGLRMRQRPLTGRRRRIIALDHFRSLAALLLQLE